MIQIFIKENSWIAKVSAYKLGVSNCATVIGSTIHLYNTSKQDFLTDILWLRHEVCHIKQWKRNTYVLFALFYLWYSLIYGYTANPYEIEARKAERDSHMLDGVEIL